MAKFPHKANQPFVLFKPSVQSEPFRTRSRKRDEPMKSHGCKENGKRPDKAGAADRRVATNPTQEAR